MNNKGHYGAKSELEQWDMSDIKQIEIVRGPGSVTYGPGAVAGVINIITRDAEFEEGMKIAGRYVSEYDSEGLTFSYGHKNEKFSVYTFGSFTRTQGDNSRQFFGTSNQTPGYVSEDILPNSEPLDYFADYQDDPQIKLHLDISFLDHWRFWSRFTQQGSTWKGNEVKSIFPEGLLNQQGVSDRQWAATLQYDNELRNDLSISVMLSADSSDVERRRERPDVPDPAHPLNKEINFSETELFFRGILNWQASEDIEIAAGTEYSRDFFGPGWGDSKNDMRIGERGSIISSPLSNTIRSGITGSADRFGTELFVDDGWDTNSYSFFTEININVSSGVRFLLSTRIDKNTFSDWLFSPRVALISQFGESNELKLIAQQAKRMSTAGQLYALNQNNNNPETESLNNIEFIYSRITDSPFTFSTSLFWTDSEVIAWDNNVQATNLVGDLQLFGIEPELSYKWGKGEIGLNYSFVKQLDWKMTDGVSSSGISYSDYNQTISGTTGIQTGVGNDLNNWSNHVLKLYTRTNLSEKLLLHTDARMLWDNQGAQDGLTSLAIAFQGLPEEAAVEAAIARVEEVGAYEYDFRLNASLYYEFNKNLSIQILAQNLLGKDGNKRYSYDSGNRRVPPHRVRFTEEPRTFGVRLDYKF